MFFFSHLKVAVFRCSVLSAFCLQENQKVEPNKRLEVKVLKPLTYVCLWERDRETKNSRLIKRDKREKRWRYKRERERRERF